MLFLKTCKRSSGVLFFFFFSFKEKSIQIFEIMLLKSGADFSSIFILRKHTIVLFYIFKHFKNELTQSFADYLIMYASRNPKNVSQVFSFWNKFYQKETKKKAAAETYHKNRIKNHLCCVWSSEDLKKSDNTPTAVFDLIGKLTIGCKPHLKKCLYVSSA